MKATSNVSIVSTSLISSPPPHSAVGLNFLHSFFCQLSVNASLVAIHIHIVRLNPTLAFWPRHISMLGWCLQALPGPHVSASTLLHASFLCLSFFRSSSFIQAGSWCLCIISFSLQYATLEPKVVSQLSWLSLLKPYPNDSPKKILRTEENLPFWRLWL